MGLATCAARPTGDPDDAFLVEALRARGLGVEWIVWSESDPRDLSESVDLLVLRSTWDYTRNLQGFLSWLDESPVPVCNSPSLVRWNSDKSYLVELASAGVPTVPTVTIHSTEQPWSVPEGYAEFVVKPAVGSGSLGAQRFLCGDVEGGQEHIEALLDLGLSVLIQPYLPSVDEGSETGLVHIDREFSHAVTKGPMLRREGPVEPVDGLYLAKHMGARTATDTHKQVAALVLEALPELELLYARIDLVDGLDGSPLLLEVEAVEPLLFFAFRPAAAEYLADAIVKRL